MTGLPPPEYITAEGDRFVVPEGYLPDEHSARCRSCRFLIVWTVTPSGARMPINPEGVSHFATCPQSAAWRKR